MLKEDKKLKLLLVLQSFCPLFLLIFIKYVGNGDLVLRFFAGLCHCDWSVIGKACKSSSLGNVVITTICVAWFLITIIVALGFKKLQSGGYDHHGEMITIGSEKKDSGVTFLVTFILPLLVEDVSTLRGFTFFIVLLALVILLLMRSDLFYQNPVLVALKYKTYEFQFVNPYKDVQGNKTYIGLSKGDIPSDKVIIKRQYIADDVFLIYNDNNQQS